MKYKMYSMDNNEKFPNSFTGMVEYADSSKLYVCPSDGDRTPAGSASGMTETNCSYIMVSGLSESSKSSYLHICDKNGVIGGGATAGMIGDPASSTNWGGNHAGAGGNVLYVDGSVAWENTKDYSTNTLGGWTYDRGKFVYK